MLRPIPPIAAAVIATLSWLTVATAQMRTIPDDAKRGVLEHQQDMVVTIDGKRAELAPGAQIRNESNMIIVPTTIPPGALVRYMVGPDGQLSRVWILTPTEAAQRDARR